MPVTERETNSDAQTATLLAELPKIDEKQLLEALSETPFDVEKVFELLKSSQALADFFKGDVGVWEKYTLEEHTRMVMRQYEKYFAGRWESHLITEKGFRMMLVLHDIGKPLAVKETGDTSRQHEYTLRIFPDIIKKSQLSDEEIEILTLLVNHDIMGKYFRSRIDLTEAVEKIKELAKMANVPAAQLVPLLRMYFMCDAGSYTEDSGGLHSLDDLFVFGENADGTKQMDLAPMLDVKMDLLFAALFGFQ